MGKEHEKRDVTMHVRTLQVVMTYPEGLVLTQQHKLGNHAQMRVKNDLQKTMQLIIKSPADHA